MSMADAVQDVLDMCEAFYLSNEAKPFANHGLNTRLYAVDKLNPYDQLILNIVRRLRAEQQNTNDQPGR